jgi:hypothetical protein
MNRFLAKFIFLFVLLLPLTVIAQDIVVKADVAISIQQGQVIWAGQQITINLDLKTTGFSFSNSHFNLPEVDNAFLMQTDTTTIKLTENIDGQSWQIVRYPLALYPQKAGQLEIPSIGVRFTTSAGFGSTETEFEFQTRPLIVNVNLPPGVKEGDLVVTTTSFELDHSWQPESGATKTGDALTLTVTRRANDISAMLLPPLPVFRTEGLTSYPQSPDINDRSNRGELTGERVDSIIWVVEKPGKYDIPGIRFQWFDPTTRELKQKIIAGISLDILPSPAANVSADTGNKTKQSSIYNIWLLVVLLAAMMTVILWLRFKPKGSGQSAETEKTAFATLQKACNGNHIGQTYSTLHVWLGWYSRHTTLIEFAQRHNDTQLGTEVKRLQESLISSDSNWRGRNLLNALRRTRSEIIKQKTIQKKSKLAPLNP